MRQVMGGRKSAAEELYALREQPDVWLKVAAFLKRSLGRTIQLREASGFLDPHVLVGGIEYSLFREEGHGLRELVLLLAATYRDDWSLLVVDEPELHLHPSMARLWLAELQRECTDRGRRCLVVTHEPSLLRMREASHWRPSGTSKPAVRPSALPKHCLIGSKALELIGA